MTGPHPYQAALVTTAAAAVVCSEPDIEPIRRFVSRDSVAGGARGSLVSFGNHRDVHLLVAPTSPVLGLRIVGAPTTCGGL